MDIRVLDDAAPSILNALKIEDLIVRRLVAADELLDTSHDLLLKVFDSSVVDPKSVYVDALTDRANTFRDFPPLFFACLLPHGQDEWLAGFVSSDLMLIEPGGDRLHLAVGNIATSPKLRDIGFRGVGTKLWHAALHAAKEEASSVAKRIAYSSAEAEPASLPFWSKLGYRWPQGVKYFQPPLEFDNDGNPKEDEVPETLLVLPIDTTASSIEARELRGIIESIYWNWGVRPSIRKLNSAAFARAKECVIGRVLQRTLESVPTSGTIPLVEVPAEPIA